MKLGHDEIAAEHKESVLIDVELLLCFQFYPQNLTEPHNSILS